MSVILLLIPLSVVLAGLFLAAFLWAVSHGQYDDTCTPSARLLTDDASSPSKNTTNQHPETRS
jgi:cbb3-type cytochrome oxidase maturation protein